MQLPQMSTVKPSGSAKHSDNGEYTDHLKRNFFLSALNLVWYGLNSLNVVQSFFKKGCPFDNAYCECFFKYLKKKETNRRTYSSFRELKLSVFEYIDGYYNSRRPYGTLGMLTLNRVETLYWEQKL